MTPSRSPTVIPPLLPGLPLTVTDLVDNYYRGRHKQFPTRTRMYAETVMKSILEQDQRNEDVMEAMKMPS